MQDKDKKIFLKRGRNKYATIFFTVGLIEHAKSIKSPMEKSYRNSIFCNHVLAERNGKLASSYCKTRWCLVCNRNRIGKLINEYKPVLDEIKDWYFVTLTAKTVPAEKLPSRIEDMNKVWRKIYDNSKKRKINLKGIRKLECTARPKDLYHPHFHFLIEGKDNAQWVIDQWLVHWLDDATRPAQDIRKADDRSLMEIFKYFTKMIIKTDPASLFEPKEKTKQVHAEKRHNIFSAMQNRRVFDSFGGIKKINEEVDERATIPAEYEGQMFKWVHSDWFDTSTGEALTEWVPSAKFQELMETQ